MQGSAHVRDGRAHELNSSNFQTIKGVNGGEFVGACDEFIAEVTVARAVPVHLKPLYVNLPKIGLWNSPITHDGARWKSIVVDTAAPGVFVIMRSKPLILKLGLLLKQQLCNKSVLLESDAFGILSFSIMCAEEYVL